MAQDKKKLRILILIFNVFFAICGFVLLVFNAFQLFWLTKYKTFIGSDCIWAVVLVILTGIICCAISRLGWKVTRKADKLYIILFGVLLLILSACSLGFCFWILAIIHNLKNQVTSTIEKTFTSVTTEKVESLTKIWESIQSELSCCGVGGPTDYRATQSIPWSCCKRIDNNETPFMGDCSSMHQRGCLLSVFDETRSILLYSALSSLGISLVQILGAIGYFYLAKALPRSLNAQQPTAPPSRDANRTLLANQSKY